MIDLRQYTFGRIVIFLNRHVHDTTLVGHHALGDLNTVFNFAQQLISLRKMTVVDQFARIDRAGLDQTMLSRQRFDFQFQLRLAKSHLFEQRYRCGQSLSSFGQQSLFAVG